LPRTPYFKPPVVKRLIQQAILLLRVAGVVAKAGAAVVVL
jgi:hypothetical protein